MDHDDYKILKVPCEIVSKMIDYIGAARYETYSIREMQFVTRNTFHIRKLEAVSDGTLVHLEVFGRNKLKKLEDLKTFVRGLEKLFKEKNNAAPEITAT